MSEPADPSTAHARPGLLALLSTPFAVAAIVALVWAVWAAGVVNRQPVGALVNVGAGFLQQGAGSSPVIDSHHVQPVGDVGYDGQFFYYIALDPRHARAYIDGPPSYRYSRPLYALVARAAALGRPGLVPWTLLIVNLLAVIGGTYALAVLLRRRGASPYYALLFGFAPGLYEAVNRDLSEPLAYALVLAALAAWWWDDLPRPWLTGILLGLAGITRETTLLFPLALVAAALFGLHDGIGSRRGRDVRSSLVLAVCAFAPFIALRLALLAWLGHDRTPPAARFPWAPAARFPWAPFGGLLAHWPLNHDLLEQVWGVVIPSLVALVLVAVLTRRLGPSLLALALNVGVLVVYLPTPSYDSIIASSRIALGVTCAFVACLPVVPAARRPGVALGVAVLAMAPWFSLFPDSLGR